MLAIIKKKDEYSYSFFLCIQRNYIQITGCPGYYKFRNGKIT